MVEREFRVMSGSWARSLSFGIARFTTFFLSFYIYIYVLALATVNFPVPRCHFLCTDRNIIGTEVCFCLFWFCLSMSI